MGTRGWRRVARGCGDACSVRESRTVTLLVRRRASAVVLGVTITLRAAAITLRAAAITLRAAVRAASAPPAHAVFPYFKF